MPPVPRLCIEAITRIATEPHLMSMGAKSFVAASTLLATTCANAANWDWTYTFSSAAHVDAHPVVITPPSARGFWAVGDSLLHYHADASLDFATRVEDSGTIFQGRSAELADGGLVLVGQPINFNEYPHFCTVTAFSSQGNARWQTTLGSYDNCDIGIDGNNVVWIETGDNALFGFSADGSSQVSYSAFDDMQQSIAGFAVDARAGGVFLATDGVPATIMALDASAAMRWSWTDTTTNRAFAATAVGTDGNLYAVAIANTSLSIVSFTPAGAIRFDRTEAPVNSPHVLGAAAASGGGVYVAYSVLDANSTTNVALQLIDAEGNLLWTQSLDGGTSCQELRCSLTVTPEGDVALTVSSASGAEQLVRYNGNGARLLAYPLDNGFVGSVASLANGNILATQGSDASEPQTFNFLELDRAGNVVAAPATVVGGSTDGGLSVFADDGTAYVWVSDETAGPLLAKIGPTGELLWKTATAGTDVSAYALSAAGSRVCVGEDRAAQQFYFAPSIVCFDAGTGEQLWSVQLDPPFFGYGHSPLQVLDDGSVVVLHIAGSGSPEHMRFDGNGTVMHRFTIPAFSYFATVLSGRSAIIQSNGSNLLSYDADGALIFNVPFAPQLTASVDLALNLSADGSAVIAADVQGSSGITPYVWSVNADGTTRWTKPLQDPPLSGDYVTGVRSIAASDGKLITAFHSQSENSYTLQARVALTGDLIWENVAEQGNTPLEDPATKRIVLVGPVNDKLSIVAIDPASGATESSVYEDCPADAPPGGYPFCLWNRFAISLDGTLRVDMTPYSLTRPRMRQLFAKLHVGSVPQQVRIDQAGLDGAWYAPYESGQGFTFDYIAGAATVFMPWFTYTQDGSEDPAGLAWYTLQGTITPGATSADLQIGQTDPGMFNSGSVGSHVVGTAHLAFSDCNSGSLYYQFNADTNNAAGGLITLTRLSPSTAPCTLADASSVPAQIGNGPAQGFDALQSGSWFDPSDSGQGLEMTIIPAGSGFSGLAFAAWFTFDPSGKADDSAQQHWFTLQGDLATAANSTITLPILRTIGGSFDGLPTGNTTAVGHAALTMLGCDKATLSYQFDDSEVAHAFAGLAGTTHLVKIGGCTAP
jgi:hypothetical protein